MYVYMYVCSYLTVMGVHEIHVYRLLYYLITTIVILCTDLPFGGNISPLVVEVTPETNDRLHVKIYDPNHQRWEVPTRLVSWCSM